MKQTTKNINLHIRIEPVLMEELKKIADAEHTTISQWIRSTIWQNLYTK